MPEPNTSPRQPTPGPPAAPPAARRQWLSAQTIRVLYRWLLIAVPVGVVSGFAAVAFLTAYELVSALLLGQLIGLDLPSNGVIPSGTYSWASDPLRFWILPAILAGAGLAVGVLASRFAPETFGHGTDETIRAFHHGRGAVKVRVPFIKLAISVLTLGSGGSGGREGPTAQIGSGFASLVGRYLGLTTRERRIALMVGMAAGIGAIFKAPFGAALLAAEILYLSDFEPEVIMPSIVASVLSYSIFGSFEGFTPEFLTPGGFTFTPSQLPLYVILGVIAGLLGSLYAVSFARSRQFFRRMTAPEWPRPANGPGHGGVVDPGE